MYRFLLAAALAGAATFGLCAQAPAAKKNPPAAAAFDKGKFEAYLRHLNIWPANIVVEVRDPKPAAELPGFRLVTVKASLGDRSTEQEYFVSADAKRIVQGKVYSLEANPFAREIAAINNNGKPALGTAGAPVVVAIYSDFQCSYCQAEAKMLRENLTQTFPKQVRAYFHDFPLEQIHPWARAGAVAGRCIARQGDEKFWKYHDWIFEKQTEITVENLKPQLMAWAAPNQVDTLALGRCLDSKEADVEVTAQLAAAAALGINSTPTLFVNGRKLAGSMRWEDLKRVIDMEIAYQASAKNAGDTACCSVELKLPGTAKE